MRPKDQEQDPPQHRHRPLVDVGGQVPPPQDRDPGAHHMAQDAPQGHPKDVFRGGQPDGGNLAPVPPFCQESEREGLDEDLREEFIVIMVVGFRALGFSFARRDL